MNRNLVEEKMDLFPQDLEVELYKTGFEYDLLNRKVISRQLSEFVEKIDNPIVIALDDKWGSGKTYFLKRWVGAHKAENGGSATTVYFDAFANDYLSEPLVSIISAVSERITADGSETLQKWKNVAAKLIKPTFGLALSLVTLGAKQHLEDFGDAVADAVSSEAKDTAEGLWAAEKEKKDALREFTSLLRELTTQSGAPIVIVVDELDRCRPDYALSVLEIIKHFFSVPQVHFVLGINGTALESSVRARYGVDIDAESYLRKFINVSFSLPQFVVGQENSGVLKKYASEMSSEMGLHEQVSRKCTELVGHVSHSNKISLRDIGKILSRIALLPKSFPKAEINEGYIEVICLLIVSIVVRPKKKQEKKKK